MVKAALACVAYIQTYNILCIYSKLSRSRQLLSAGLMVKAALNSAVFHKAVRLSNAARQASTPTHVIYIYIYNKASTPTHVVYIIYIYI